MEEYGCASWALEMQAPWSGHVVDGRKTIETRRYPLPDFISLPATIAIVQPSSATPGVAALGDEVQAGDSSAVVVGTARFASRGCHKHYTKASPDEFQSDFPSHMVEPMSETYGFGNPTLDEIYGWVIESAEKFQPPRPVPKLQRLHRSIFAIQLDDITASTLKLQHELCSLPSPPPEEAQGGDVIDLDISCLVNALKGEGGDWSLEDMHRTPACQEMVSKFQEQCRKVGFFRVHYDSYPVQLAADVHALSRKFFSLPADRKVQASKSGASTERQNDLKCTGYRPKGASENNLERESWSGSKLDVRPDEQVPWPNSEEAWSAEFRSSIKAWYAEMDIVSSALLMLLAAALDLEPQVLLGMKQGHASSLNLFSVVTDPSSEKSQGKDGVLVAHADITTFTIISHDTETEGRGLEVLEETADSCAKCWRPVKSSRGSLLVNFGQIAERWSGGVFKANLHRVVRSSTLLNGDLADHSPRQSIIFFGSVRDDAILQVLKPNPSSASIYAPERMSSYLHKRMNGFYQIGSEDQSNIEKRQRAWVTYNQDVLRRIWYHQR